MRIILADTDEEAQRSERDRQGQLSLQQALVQLGRPLQLPRLLAARPGRTLPRPRRSRAERYEHQTLRENTGLTIPVNRYTAARATARAAE